MSVQLLLAYGTLLSSHHATLHSVYETSAWRPNSCDLIERNICVAAVLLRWGHCKYCPIALIQLLFIQCCTTLYSIASFSPSLSCRYAATVCFSSSLHATRRIVACHFQTLEVMRLAQVWLTLCSIIVLYPCTVQYSSITSQLEVYY